MNLTLDVGQSSPTYVQLFSTPQRRGEPTRIWRANFGASKGDAYGEYWKLGSKKRCAMRRSGGAQGWITSFWRWKEDGGRGLAMSFAWRKAGTRSRRCLGRPLGRGTGVDHSALGGGPSRTRWKQLERRGTSCGGWPRGLFLESPENFSGPRSHLLNCQPLVLESRSFVKFSR